MTEFFEWRDAPSARFAVIGDPVGHSLSPKMQNAALRSMGEPGEYVAIRVPPNDACPALDHLAKLGYGGVNVTVPNKFAVLPWLATLDPFAERIGAVNTIDLRTRKGINTDAPGFLDTLGPLNLSDFARVLVLGAGGSARAIVAALTDVGALASRPPEFAVVVWNRTQGRAEALVRELGMLATVQPDPTLDDFDLIVNATSSTLQEDQDLNLDWASARPDAIAYDLSYPTNQSHFLVGAGERGLKAIDGIELLIAQGARSLEWWLDKPVPRDAMREALR